MRLLDRTDRTLPIAFLGLLLSGALVRPLVAQEAVALDELLPPTTVAGDDENEAEADLETAEQRRRQLLAIERAGDSGDRRFVPPLLDLLAWTEDRDEWFAVLGALGSLLDRDLTSTERPWRTLREELGAGMRGHASYPSFKRTLYAQTFDAGYLDLLPAEPSPLLSYERLDWGGVPIDGIPALLDPPTVDVETAEEELDLDPDEPVLGLSIDGHARAYPLRILDWHELANDRLGDTAFALSYCTLCGAGIAYRTGGATERSVLGTSGLLLDSNKLMFDDRTGSLWRQLDGRAVTGPAVGTPPLPTLPTELVSWETWSERHPDTTVVHTDTGFERDYSRTAAYGVEFSSSRTMFPTATSTRLGPCAKERLLVVRAAAGSIAFAIEEFAPTGEAIEVLRPSSDEGRDAPELLLIRRRGPAPELPRAWRAHLASIDALRALDLERLDALLTQHPDLADELGARLLLELPRRVRLALFDLARDTTRPRAWSLPEERMRRVGELGMALDLRAYEAPPWTPTVRGADGVLVDPEGRPVAVTADGLRDAEGSLWRRLPSFLVHRFAWESLDEGSALPAPR